jgi:beta-1,4-N-acetylglucosaminyltransferase
MKICLVCSSGGHFNQMRRLVKALDGHDYFFVTFFSEANRNLKNAYKLKFEGWNLRGKISVFKTVIKAIYILLKERPNIIMTTGGGDIAIPFCYIGKLLRINIIYIETLARIESPSPTGKIIYPIADLFLVQWMSLLKKYGKKARYWGKVA